MISRTATGQEYLKILDFGVAKIRREGDQQNTVETKAGLIVGSLRYISPEQVESGDITPRTDLYSFGCVLYEMLAGRRVFDYPSPADCAIAHLTEPPRPPVVDGQPLVGPLVDFIMRCLEKKQAGRPANAREALTILQRCKSNPVLPQSSGGAPQASEALTALGVPAMADTNDSMPGQALKATVRAEQAAATFPGAQRAPTLGTSPPADVAAGGGAHRPTTPVHAAANAGAGRGPDLQMRPRTGSGLDIVGGGGSDISHTATAMDGMMLARRPPVQPIPKKRSLWWLWGLLAIVVGGGAAALIIALVKPAGGPSGATSAPHEGTVVGTIAGAVDAGAPAVADAAAVPETSASPDTQPVEVAAETSAEVAGADAASAAEDWKARGMRLTTSPVGATVTVGDVVVGPSPVLVTWDAATPPPLVRVTLDGYIGVDLQLVRGDRGQERTLELRRRNP
jgi:serine/threonine-protein kinase